MEALNTLKTLSSQSVDLVKRSVHKTTNWITDVLRKLDGRIRTNDHRINYTYGDKKPILLKADGHYFFISWVVLFLLTFLILGPNLDSVHGYALILLALFYIVAVLIPLKLAKPNNLFWYQAGLLALLSLAIWFVFSNGHIERDGELYKHILFPGFWLMLVGILLSRRIAPWLLRRFESSFADYIKQVELFYSTQTYPMTVSWRAYLRSLFTAPFYNPVKLLLFPSMCVLLMADRNLMWWSVGIVGFITWSYLAAANVHERLHYLAEVLNGIFFKGGQLVVSIFVIAVAIGRVFDESHITTLIESSPGKVNMTIIRYVAVAYILFWFFEYWINRSLLDNFVSLFATTKNENEPGRVEFDAYTTKTAVDEKGRVLQAHGGSRLIVLGKHKKQSYPCWHTYSRGGLLDMIFSQLDKADSDVYEDYQKAQAIKQRMRVFFLILNLYLVLSIVGMTIYYASLPQKAEASSAQLTQQEKDELFNLHEHLFLKKDYLPGEPLIFVAASGGGTRAAIYGESVLRGLRDYGLLDNVVLTSSVSGGSAAMAYFAAYREELINGDEARWEVFSKTMAEPFIQDVLEGIVDWRIVGGVVVKSERGKEYKAGFRLGELLAESFEHRFGFVQTEEEKKQRLPTRNAIGIQKNFGAIFNTAIVAKYPRWDCATVAQNEEWKQCVCATDKPLALRENECSDLRTSIGKGGRLIFTNLQNIKGFPNSGKPVTDNEYLTYEVVQDPKIPLSQAAALSANFPPVFPNAAVDVENVRRYWVTDGGASDNRGILSLLYALREAIKEEQERCKTANCANAPRHELHVFIAEASATTLSFTRSSGISAVFGAPARFASQLMVDMAREVEEKYAELKGKIHFHYLAMPLILRSNGGLGTHWMLPTSVRFKQPLDIGLQGEFNKAKPVKLSGDLTRKLVDELHVAKQVVTNNPDMDRLWRWICLDQNSSHQQVWNKAISQIDSKAIIPDRCANRK
jgi:hypothetical protein